MNKNGFEIIDYIDYENHSTIYHTKKNNNINNNLITNLKIQNYCNDFFNLITEYNLFIEKCNLIINDNLNKQIFIFGASSFTQLLLYFGLHKNVQGILDNSKEKQDKYFYGYNLKIYSPEILLNNDNFVVILKNGYYTNEIFLQIKKINSNIIIIK